MADMKAPPCPQKFHPHGAVENSWNPGECQRNLVANKNSFQPDDV